MPNWPGIPEDVIEYFRGVFRDANRHVTGLLYNMPNVRESSLDDYLISSLIQQSPPRVMPSGAVVEMDIHNIGGLRRVYKWETADIAVLVFVYRGANIVAQKIGFLQSKRLYPLNNDVMDEDPVGFRYGMNAMLRRDAQSPLGRLNKNYKFTQECFYRSIKSGDNQIYVIDNHNENFGESVYYLLYTPPKLPVEIAYPIITPKRIRKIKQGCLVFRANPVHQVLRALKAGASPTHRQLVEVADPTEVASLERWAADLLLTCRTGQPFGQDREELVSRMLERRSGPIAASIAVSIILPEG